MDTQTFGGWYVLKTKPRQEDRALENLNRQGFKCFGPKLNVERIVRGKRSLRTEPLFPGYVFVQSDELAEQFYKLRSTYGVHSLVRFGDRIPKLPQSWIDSIRGMEASAEALVFDRQNVRPNERHKCFAICKTASLIHQIVQKCTQETWVRCEQYASRAIYVRQQAWVQSC